MLRAAIIGYGYMGSMYNDIIDSLGWQLIGVHDVDKDKFKSVASNQFYEKRELLIAHKDVDVVIIATPHNEHLALLKECLQHNKHVILEKPLAGSMEDAESIYQLANQHKSTSIVMVNITHCFYDNIQKAKKMIAENNIGSIKSIDDRVIFAVKEEARNLWFFKKEVAGHGVMHTNGCHLLARILFLFSDYKPKFELVAGVFGNTNQLGDIDDTAAHMRLNLLLSDGRKIPVNIFANWPMQKEINEKIEESMVIHTDKGKLQVQAWKDVKFYEDCDSKLSTQVEYHNDSISPEIQKGVTNVLKAFQKELEANKGTVHYSTEYTYQAEKLICDLYSRFNSHAHDPKNRSQLVTALHYDLPSRDNTERTHHLSWGKRYT